MISNSEIVTKLGAAQSQIWGTVSMIVSEACNQMVAFSDPLTVATTTAEMAAEITSPMLVLQFSFADSQDHVQIILVPQETFGELAGLVKGQEVEEIDDNLVVDVRPQLEAIIQGICVGVGNVRNEPVVSSGISIRHQIFQFPQNLQRTELLARTQIALKVGEISGAAIWLMDADTALYILNEEASMDDETAPFLQVQAGGQAASGQQNPHDEGGLGILLDIPLDISVELGRVKMVVRDVLELGSGSIVELDKAAGEPVDVMVNGRLVARGEVVVIEDNFGVRVTEICSAMDRLARANEAA